MDVENSSKEIIEESVQNDPTPVLARKESTLVQEKSTLKNSMPKSAENGKKHLQQPKQNPPKKLSQQAEGFRRRFRIKVRPNLKIAVRLRDQFRRARSLSACNPKGAQKPTTPDANTDAAASSSVLPVQQTQDNCSENVQTPLAVNIEQTVRSVSPLKSPNNAAGKSTHPTRHLAPRTAAIRNPWTMTRYGDPHARKKFTGNEPFNAKKMRMFDLISWNPKKEQGLKHASPAKAGSTQVTEETISDEEEFQSDPGNGQRPENGIAAPQVRLTEDGTLVVDESSLTLVSEKRVPLLETVSEDQNSSRVTSLSFRKTAWRKGTPWSALETDLFYDIVRATGPDFGLMHEFFPSRARSELKSKFNREEKTNWERLKGVLESPSLLDQALFTKSQDMVEKIREEERIKKEKRLAKKLKKQNGASTSTSEGDLIEEELDLTAAAEAEIERLIAEEREEAERAKRIEEEEAKKKAQAEEEKKKKDDAEKRKAEQEQVTGEDAKKKAQAEEEKKKEDDAQKRKAEREQVTAGHSPPKVARRAKTKDEILKETEECVSRIMSERKRTRLTTLCNPLKNLSDEFPKFQLIFAKQSVVTIEPNPNGNGPLLRVPLGTMVHVEPKDATKPERVYFKCPGNRDVPPREYAIQHQCAADKSSSGFLTLFGTP